MFEAPLDVPAPPMLLAAGQTLAARAAAISSRLGVPWSTTTIVTRWTSNPPRVCTEIR